MFINKTLLSLIEKNQLKIRLGRLIYAFNIQIEREEYTNFLRRLRADVKLIGVQGNEGAK